MKTIEEFCVKCGTTIYAGQGRYHFAGGTQCETCGDPVWIRLGIGTQN